MNLFTKPKKENTDVIPKQFIRIWLGPKKIPDLFEKWWLGFQDIHPDYDFVTITDQKSMLHNNTLDKRHRFIDASSSDFLASLPTVLYQSIIFSL